MFVYLRAQPTFIAARYTITSPRRPRDVGRLAGGRVGHVPQPYGDGATSGTSSRKLAQILWMLGFVGACNSNKFLQLRQFDQVRRSLLDRLPPGRHHLLHPIHSAYRAVSIQTASDQYELLPAAVRKEAGCSVGCKSRSRHRGQVACRTIQSPTRLWEAV